MKKTGIFYGSTTGTTESVARLIADKLGIAPADVHEVTKLDTALAESYEALILGTSTWGDGELQDDWYDGLKVLQGAHLSGKVVALFGCGDSESYSDTFCDALGLIYEALLPTGCTFIGACDPDGCDATASRLCREGRFVGLAVDESDPDRSEARTAAWCERIREGR